MKGCLTSLGAFFVLVFAIAAIAGGKSSSTTTSTTSTTEPASATETHTTAATSEAQTLNRGPIPASVSRSCGREISGSSATSCAFAEKVLDSYASLYESNKEPPAHVTAYSPVTNREYTLDCVLVSRGITVECIKGTAAVVFPLVKVTDPQTSTPEAQPESKSEEGEDEVGSSSHAGDAKFCEEHHCIGDFTTEDGTVVECKDGSFSHAGGISGSCSYHGGDGSASEEESSGE